MPDVHLGMPNTGIVWPGGASKQGPHRVGAFATCAQLEGLGYELNLRSSVEKDAPKIGTLVHVGLAYRYGMQLAQRPDWLVYPDPRTALWTCGQDRLDIAGEALRVYDAYCAYWDPLIASGAAPRFEPILVEYQFEVAFPMPDGTTEPYTCRIDLLAKVGNEIWVVDHKCGSKLSNHSGDKYEADRQMLTNLALARACGYHVDKVVINACSRENPTPRFARFPVDISAEAYNRLWDDTRYVLTQMRWVRQNYPDATKRPRTLESCIRKYGRCDFTDVCHGGPQHLVQFVSRT